MDLLTGILANVWSWVVLALGLGLVIFVHELGHFAVAKWVGVFVERFSIGFGPVIWSIRRGETEYALSAIPFGGYVKMLGQDDVNPAEMTREDLKLDPRSYPAQSVPKRMAIISAGVIMNIIFAFLCFLFVFNIGMPYTPALVGSVDPGGPAWQAGIERGDKIVRVNDEEIVDFKQFQQAVVLSDPKEGLELEVERGGAPINFHVVPDTKNSHPQIGVDWSSDLKLHTKRPVGAGLAASKAEGVAFQGGDRITHVNDEPMHSYPQFADYLATHANDELRMRVLRSPQKGSTQNETAEVVVPRQTMRDWGLRFQMGRVAAVRKDSPAATAGIKPGDVIQSVAGQPCDPLRLPSFVAGLAGLEPDESGLRPKIELEIKRESQGDEILHVTVEPEDRPGWINPPLTLGSPLAIPALGIAYQLEPVITAQPDADSPAGRAGLQKLDRIYAVKIIWPPKRAGKPPEEEDLVIDEKNPVIPAIFWQTQFSPDAKLQFKVKRDGKETETDVFLPAADESWFASFRGIHVVPLNREMEPQGFSRAIVLGYKTTKSWITSTYLTLHRLTVSRTVSPKNLMGPLGILGTGAAVAQTDIRLFIEFMAILGVNLAIINFLPIPVLDGGHMVLLAWEGIRGKPASDRVIIAANYCGLLLILSLFLFVTWNDIARWVK